MASNLVESLSGLMTPDVVGRTASSLGESTTGIAKASGASFSSLLAGVLSRSGNPGAMDQIFRLVSSPANDGSVLNNVGGLVSNTTAGVPTQTTDLGHRLLNQVFGGQIGGVTGALGHYAGIRESSATAMLGVAAPLVLGQLGRVVRTEGLNASGLRDVLSSQRDSIMRNVPAGLSSLVALGTAGPAARAEEFVERDREVARRPSWVIPAVLALLALLAWWVMRPRTTAITTGTPANAALSAITLPGGRQILAAPNGIESSLLAFLRDGSRPVSNDTWFDFDRLRFDTGSARITPDSRPQLANIAAIFGAFPDAKARVGGYTDNVGDAAANQRLAQDRADGVRNELIALGVAPGRLIAQGYGEQRPQASNATAAGRAANRSVSLQITAK
jgi:OOP family OmpA-OmpF porin